MTIEQKINNILLQPHGDVWFHPVETWSWFAGRPAHLYSDEDFMYVSFGDYYERFKISWVEVTKETDEIIQRADDVECLTSNSEYIRECKKWYMGNVQ